MQFKYEDLAREGMTEVQEKQDHLKISCFLTILLKPCSVVTGTF